MAVYTHVEQSQLVEFLAGYSIGSLVSYQGIAEGVENSNYLLHTTHGRYILTLFEQRTRVEDLPYFLGLKQHLSAAGIPCPLPIAANQGQTLGQLAGRAATIVSFLEGKSIKEVTASHCYQVGSALGRLHLVGQTFTMQRKNGLDPTSWRPLFERSRPRSNEVQLGLGAWLEEELNYLETEWPNDLPVGVIHADLFRDNVFFAADKLSGLIDFYFACNDLLAYDLAITLNAWCFTNSLRLTSSAESKTTFGYHQDFGSALFAGYRSQRKLEINEIDQFSILCRGAAIRFLLTRLYDWLHVPEGALTIPHDPKEYIAKLEFHQSTKLRPE